MSKHCYVIYTQTHACTEKWNVAPWPWLSYKNPHAHLFSILKYIKINCARFRVKNHYKKNKQIINMFSNWNGFGEKMNPGLCLADIYKKMPFFAILVFGFA